MISERYAKKFCSEDISKIENYDKAIADTTQTWEIHHRLGISENKSKSQLIAENLYYRRPASELIFLTPTEHNRLHNCGENNPMYGTLGGMYGKHHSDATKQKMKEAHLGKHHSEAAKQKMRKPKSVEHVQKIRDAKRGTFWWNNGVICKMSKDCPGPEWKRGRLKQVV